MSTPPRIKYLLQYLGEHVGKTFECVKDDQKGEVTLSEATLFIRTENCEASISVLRGGRERCIHCSGLLDAHPDEIKRISINLLFDARHKFSSFLDVPEIREALSISEFGFKHWNHDLMFLYEGLIYRRNPLTRLEKELLKMQKDMYIDRPRSKSR